MTDTAHTDSVHDKLIEELDSARREALSNQKLVKVTPEEAKNGWTDKTLTAYLAEREAGQSLAVDVNSLHRRNARKPQVQNHRYSPLRWRE